nr:PD40 domain-containing protein [Rubrobacter marinus]
MLRGPPTAAASPFSRRSPASLRSGRWRPPRAGLAGAAYLSRRARLRRPLLPGGEQARLRDGLGGNERSQLFLLDPATGEDRDLTRAPGAIHYFGGFSPDGSRIAYTATRRNGTDFDVFTQGLAPGDEPETVWEVSGYHTVQAWSPDGSFLVVSRHHSNLNNDLYRLDLASGEATLLTPHEGDARFSGPRSRRAAAACFSRRTGTGTL